MANAKKDKPHPEEALVEVPDATASEGATEPAPEEASPEDASKEHGENQPHPLAVELQQAKDSLLRNAAEFENFRKRQKREMDELRKYAGEKVLLEFIPVLDNLDRALQAAQKAEGAGTNLVSGVKMVADQFRGVLENHGVKTFVSVGQPFDPARHEAISEREDHGAKNGTVLEEFQKGYIMGDRVVRPAMVVVSKRPADARADSEANSELN